MARENEIRLKFTIDGKEAELTLDQLGNRAAGAGDKMRDATENSDRFVNSMTDLRNVAQGLREGFELLSGLFSKPFEEFKSQELAVARIDGLLRATGNSAKISTDNLVEMANVLSRVTNFTDDDILAAQGALLSYDKLGGTDLERIVRLSADLAAALGQDVASSAQALGKAMQDPAGGLMTLNRSLRLFTEEEKKAVESMAEAGNVAEAQEMILSRLESRISGVAEEMRNTNVGAVIQAQKEWDNLNETLGGVIAQGIEPTARGFATIAQQVNETSPALASMAGGATALTAAYVVLSATGILPMFFNTQKMAAAVDTARIHIKLAGAEATVASKSLEMAKISARGFAAALGPLGWLTLGIVAVTTAVGYMSDSVDQAASSIQQETSEIMKQKVEVNALLNILKEENTEKDVKAKAINTLNTKYKDYIGNIDLEKAGLRDIVDLQKEANKRLEESIRLKVADARVDIRTREIIEMEENLDKMKKEYQEMSRPKGDRPSSANVDIIAASMKQNIADYEKLIQKKVEEAVDLKKVAYSDILKSEESIQGTVDAELKRLDMEIANKKAAWGQTKVENQAERDALKKEITDLETKRSKLTMQSDGGKRGPFRDQGANSIKDYERSLRMLKDAGAGWNEQLEFINQSLTEVEGKLGGKLTAKEAERMQQLKVTLINERSSLMKEAEEFDKFITNLKIQSIDELRGRDLAELEWKYNEEQKMVLAKATNEEQGQAALIALKEKFLREYGEIEKKYQIGLIGEQEQRVQEAEERMRLAKTDFELAKAKDALIIEQQKLEEMKRMNARSAEEIYDEWARKNPFVNAALAGVESGVQMFWDRFAMDHRQAKDDWDAIWLAMKNRALAEIGELVFSESMGYLKGIFSRGGGGGDTPEQQGSGGGGFLNLLFGLIPFLATGGIVNKPTLAMVGEKGPEAVVPLDHYRSLFMPTPRVPMNIVLQQNLSGKMEMDIKKVRMTLSRNEKMWESLR